MNTQSLKLKEFIFAPDSTGMNITALCYGAFSLVVSFAMAVIGCLRLWGGFYVPASSYFIAALLSASLFIYSFRKIRTGNVEPLKKSG